MKLSFVGFASLLFILNSLAQVAPVLPSSSPESATVSIFQLEHKVVSSAAKEYRAALKALQNHDLKDGTTHLENAVRLDPDYLEAQIALAKCYLRSQQFEKSVAAFGQVLRMDPHCSLAYSGSSGALLLLGRQREAEQAARRAMDIDSTSMVARFFLGLSLASQTRYQEALPFLLEASRTIPKAHMMAAQIFARFGQLNDAETHAQDYLATGETDRATAAHALLEKIHAAQSSDRAESSSAETAASPTDH